MTDRHHLGHLQWQSSMPQAAAEASGVMSEMESIRYRAASIMGNEELVPSKRLLDFMPLNVQQVHRAIMERQAGVHGINRQLTYSDARSIVSAGRASSGLSMRHRAGFSGFGDGGGGSSSEDEDRSSSDERDSPGTGFRQSTDVDGLLPAVLHKGRSAPDLASGRGGADPGGPDSSSGDLTDDHHPVADEVDLAMLPRRHSRALAAQVTVQRRRKPKTRLEEIMKELMASNEHLHVHTAPSSPSKVPTRPTTKSSYTTSHLSGVSLANAALSAITRAERMLQKLHDKSVVSMELDSRPASRIGDGDPAAGARDQGRNGMYGGMDSEYNGREGPSDVAMAITRQFHGKAALFGNVVARPDSASRAKAATHIAKEGTTKLDPKQAMSAFTASAYKASRRFAIGGDPLCPPTFDTRTSSLTKRSISLKKRDSHKDHHRDLQIMKVVSSMLADEENFSLVNAARRRLEIMEKSMLDKRTLAKGRHHHRSADSSEDRDADGQLRAAAAAAAAGQGTGDAGFGGLATTQEEGEGGRGAGMEGRGEGEEAGRDGGASASTSISGAAAAAAAAAAGYVVPPSRDGGMFSGVFGRMTDIRRKMHQEKTNLIKNNPAAFQEDVAAQAEAEHRAMSERAHSKYRSAVTTLMEPRMVEEFKKAIKQLQSERPYFLPPIYERDRVERAPVQISRKEQQVRWAPERSIFLQRKKEGEARDVYDTDSVSIKQFNIDWQRVAAKVRFRKLVGREDKSVHADSQRLEEELAEVRQEVMKFRNQLRSIFNYFSSKSGPLGSEFMLNMGLNDWLGFCNDAGIIDNTKRGCTLTDMTTIFVAVNFEEEGDTQEADANDDDAMMRFEFYEGIVRSAFGRFITTGAMGDASDATERFITDMILPRMPPEALVQPNDFRRNRLYNEQMAALVEDYWDFLFATYKMYKAKDRTKFFWIEHWAVLLESVQLLGSTTGMEKREAKIIFVWSQLLVTDELKRRKRAVGLMFMDFVEALARVADFISPPSLEELYGVPPGPEAGFATSAYRGPANVHPLTEWFKNRGDKKRPPSASLLGPATRPLHVKFATLMDYLVFQLRNAWGGKDRAECAAKMMRVCVMLGAGIELG